MKTDEEIVEEVVRQELKEFARLGMKPSADDDSVEKAFAPMILKALSIQRKEILKMVENVHLPHRCLNGCDLTFKLYLKNQIEGEKG